MNLSPRRVTWPFGSRTSNFACLLVLPLAAAVSACGGEEAIEEVSKPTARAEKTEAGGNRPPQIRNVEISPESPSANGMATVSAEAFDEDGDRLRYGYEWELNGRPFGGGDTSVMLKSLRKGDDLTVTVVVSDGHKEVREKAEATIANTPPRLSEVRILVSNGEVLAASTTAEDLDADPVSFRYRWLVNDDEIDSQDPEISSEYFRAGDDVVVEVIANDGENDSGQLASEPHRVKNSRPIITSDPQEMNIIDGNAIEYQVSAKDPDPGQTLRYRLEEGPDGMNLDGMTGQLSWTPSGAQVGEFPVRIIVEDQQGGEVAQAFTVNSSIE
jgi:hypothetical protein